MTEVRRFRRANRPNATKEQSEGDIGVLTGREYCGTAAEQKDRSQGIGRPAGQPLPGLRYPALHVRLGKLAMMRDVNNYEAGFLALM